MKRRSPFPPTSEKGPSAEAAAERSPVRGFAPTTRRRFLQLVLVAGAATVAVERSARPSAPAGPRPRWIGHC